MHPGHTNDLGNLGIGDVVRDDPRKLWKVPGVPLLEVEQVFWGLKAPGFLMVPKAKLPFLGGQLVEFFGVGLY